MNTLKVRITGPHTHAGREVPIGTVIEMSAKIARLTCHVFGTGEPVDWPTKKKKATRKNAEPDS